MLCHVPLLPLSTAPLQVPTPTSDEAYQAMSVLLEGGASEGVIGAFLIALKMKGETAAGELAGFRLAPCGSG